ncbi:sodium/hydrogen exchanger 9B2 isoform X2 [Daktulosphaira vitifoliae]|uniref:sodium/hydrogen exchanger 9B2 isoform X2 n=1 Tax=Daktulosphaira vitifoliae TaxID=58002 RepID=UPI0021A9B82C|nr:sodium/hydrogen exchanger 9B2 isoform X2 [Daktulosphaira vitifoliae]
MCPHTAMAAELYVKKHDSVDLSSRHQSSIVRWQTDKIQQPVNGSSLPVNPRAMELDNLSNLNDTRKNIHQKAFKKTENYSKKLESFNGNDQSFKNEEYSWWYILCLKCRKKEVGPGWEPKTWSRGCPYPFCPSYRHVARVLALLITGALIWGVLLVIIGVDARPGGQLFNIALLVIIAYLVGWIFRMLTLPGLIGMLMVGMIFQNFGLIHVHDPYTKVVSTLRKIALVVILTRAGLDLDSKVLKKMYFRALILGLVPWFVEAAVIAITVNILLHLPWGWAILCGSIIAAVAPAVVVPCLFRLRSKGYGVAKGIPTLIIAVAGIDDAASVVVFGVINTLLYTTSPNMSIDLILSPMSIIIGILYGIVWGFIVKYIPERSDPYVVPLRILMLSGGGLLAVFGSENRFFEGAGPLAVISAAFTSIYFWTNQGWNIEDNAVATAFEIFWMIFEPILFGLTGTQIVVNNLNMKFVIIVVSCVAVAIVARIITTILVATGSSLNFKEKLFISLSWMAKASVQAALAPAVLEMAKEDGNLENVKFAQTIVMICILAILLTAPTGALLITLTGTRLLTKTKNFPPKGQWRPGPRRSIRDITINDKKDDETSKEVNTIEEENTYDDKKITDTNKTSEIQVEKV